MKTAMPSKVRPVKLRSLSENLEAARAFFKEHIALNPEDAGFELEEVAGRARGPKGLELRRYGNAGGEKGAIFFVHGFMGGLDLEANHLLCTHLKRLGYTVYAMEMRGHGATGLVHGVDFDYGKTAEDAKAAIAHILEKETGALHVIGHSGGGAVAADGLKRFVSDKEAENKERVASLLLLATPNYLPHMPLSMFGTGLGLATSKIAVMRFRNVGRRLTNRTLSELTASGTGWMYSNTENEKALLKFLAAKPSIVGNVGFLFFSNENTAREVRMFPHVHEIIGQIIKNSHSEIFSPGLKITYVRHTLAGGMDAVANPRNVRFPPARWLLHRLVTKGEEQMKNAGAEIVNLDYRH
jgi:pimeloyl-ACP methyl ester carboxylesterase